MRVHNTRVTSKDRAVSDLCMKGCYIRYLYNFWGVFQGWWDWVEGCLVFTLCEGLSTILHGC